ncbi:uncharacterized protein LOC130776214 isoform X2 [Actinidia eriantha]|uniref:uncharacterized protein LOC130776214 isoform X2 n=1 Tax=Actinidia eriantha TaxID=165200 RepID=UPI00258F6274|nr:uncharacterized protein LOC130776214 isoform X2 [Actinidia eriantha]
MSRVAKWKLEKTKVKVVFRLQFHATHIPQAGWDKLFISFVPADSVKATAKTTKANVRNGTCKWGDPIYETTRLLQDSKSKQYDEKLYKFVVAMGSSRSSILGEASINLADYADAMKPSIVALPLNGCDSGTVLHVAIQLLTSKTGFREFEQQRELRERGLQTGTDQNRHEGFGTGKVLSSVEFTNDQTDKVNARVRFRPESKDLPSLEEEVGLTEEYADSAAGFDGSSNTSESLCAEKHDTSSTHEIDSLKSIVSGDLNGLFHCQSPREEKGDTSDHRNLAQGSIDSVHGWNSDYSIDNDLAIAYEENNRLRGCLEVAESSILELKLEVSSLQSHADEIDIEARRLSQQFAAEIISGEELAKEVSVMKSECSTLKADLEELKILKLSPQFASRETSNRNQDNLFQGIQIRWAKGLLALEDKIRELQNKLYLGFHDRDFRFLHSDLEALLIFLQGLKQGTEETSCSLSLPSEMTNIKEISEINSRESKQFISGNGFDVDLYHPPDMLHCLSIPSIASQEPDLIGATVSMKEKIFELLRELDDSKADREILARKMDQMECYYEALIQELEQNQKQMLGELQNLRNEHSACLYTIATTSAEMESMRQDMNEQIIRFTEERRDLDSINKELERKAVTSEAALRRARLNYSIAVNQLQKDLDLLSSQVLSMFETNENLIKETVSETSQPYFLGNPDAARNPEESDASKLLQYQSQNAGVKKQVLGGDILLEDMNKSLLFQEGLYLKVEEELSEMHVANVRLDVFSKILQETLLEASADIMLMKKTIDELTQKMDLSTASKKLLMLQLQTAMDDVQALNEYKASCMAKCSDMALQNQILEAQFEGLSNENCLLTKKIAEWELLMREYRSYESKYKASFDEKTEMANLLKQETLNKVNLQNEVSYLQEELKTVKAEQSELAYSKENLQKTVSFLENKFWSLGESYHKNFYGLFPSTNSVRHDPGSMDFMDVIPQLEEFQHNACEKILQLLEEKKNLENERDLAQMSSSTASSELLVLKQKFKHDVQNMATKLEAANGLVENFQLELETLANKFHISSEAEDKYAHQNEELSADLTLLEAELQQLTSKNVELAKEILGLDTLTEELGRSKFIIAELTRERDLAQMSSSTASSEILVLKQKFKHDVQNMATKLEAVNGLVEKFQLELETLANKLHISSEAEEKYAHQNEELSADLALLEVELQQLTSKNVDLAKEILGLDTLTEELGRSKLIIAELTGERQDLMMSLQDKTEESVKLSSELNNLKESLRFLHDELNVERSCRDKLEGTITDLTSQLNGKNDHLLQFSQQGAELAHFRQLASDLLLEQSGVFHILKQHEECLEKIREDSSRLTDLESQSSELHEYVIAADVKVNFIRTQYETRMKEYALNIQSSEKHLGELRKKLFDVEVMLNRSLTGEAHFIEENTNLVNTVDSLRSELKASVAQNGVVSDLNSIMAVQLEEYKKRVAELDVNFSNDKYEHSLEVEKLKHMLGLYQEEIDELMSSKEEMEITVTVLKAKLDELHADVTSLEESKDELLMLQNQCNELTHRLSEQILKTEEFKNLSIHLKELKDHAEAECLQARKKREHEGPSGAVQESLRIAFIKEQYETRLQELRQQLYVSKKHGEDMLWKLQDSVDELENKKKSEASHLKRNEELALKILELEAELQSLVSEKREKIKAYDCTTAELECALLSLECCKEEKQRLEDSLHECNEENNRIATELTLTKGQLESSESTMKIRKEESNGSDDVGYTSGDTILGKAYRENPVVGTSSIENRTLDTAGNGSTGRPFSNCSDQHSLMNSEEVEDASSIPTVEDEHSTAPAKTQPFKDVIVAESGHAEQGASLLNDSKHVAVINNQFKTRSLQFSMDHLHKELEKMKNENSLLPLDDCHFEPIFQGFQTELMQLHKLVKVNEELRSIFPVFSEVPGGGNALERVLALEIELAEALQSKKKSSILFQSSFLRQHSDEQAIFQSFRDINELIKEMLELKGRYAGVESELKEMHDRYSQLSLQFAEVEGERQRLMMTLKNVRASKRFTQLNRSTSATLGDHPS